MPVGPIPARSGSEHRRQQLPDEVASYVRELIISGQMLPGAFLRMDRIAEAIGVSNTPVREGLLILSGEGFVSQVPRRGYVVAPFTPQDIRDLFWAQAVVAGELAARAAKKISPEQLARAEQFAAAYEVAYAANDEQKIADLSHALHREINLAADSIRLATLVGSIVKQLPPRFYATIEGAIEAARVEHPLIIEALRNRDAKRAKRLMEQHISRNADRIIESLKQQGLWPDSPGAWLQRPPP